MTRHVKITLRCENCDNASTHMLIPDQDSSIETKLLGGFGSMLVQIARYHEHHSKCPAPTYTVRLGDSCVNIAGRCGVDWRRWRELADFNGKKIQPAKEAGTDLGAGFQQVNASPETCTLTPGEVLNLPPGWRFHDVDGDVPEPQ